MNELFLFVRPPRPLWPFNGEGSAFWPPLGFASLAAALRTAVRDLRVGILDAPALSMGWASLTTEIARLRPAYIGIGEEAVSCKEGLRVAALAKEAGARVIAGGCFFGNVAPETIGTGLVDVVAHGEGEETIVELVPALRSGNTSDLRQVAGISFREGEEVLRTERRQPMPDIDCLPFPAYDLLPVERYGRTSRNHHALAAIELSRGCSYGCEFCVLWRQMGRYRGPRLLPYLRAKSPERLLEEIRILTKRYGRRYLGWVDPCFNAHPEVPRQLAELLLRDNCQIGQSAWVRANYVVRDAASGALEPCVRAGLNEMYMGVERLEKDKLRVLKKGNLNGETREALRILSEQYPEVYTVGTFIYGLPGDTPQSIRSMFRSSHDLPLDMRLFIPRTPLPGTPYWRPEYWDPTGEFFRTFDFLPRVNGNRTITRLTMTLYQCIALSWSAGRLGQTLRGLFARNPRYRSINLRQFGRGVKFVAAGIVNGLLGRNGPGGMRIPKWYDE